MLLKDFTKKEMTEYLTCDELELYEYHGFDSEEEALEFDCGFYCECRMYSNSYHFKEELLSYMYEETNIVLDRSFFKEGELENAPDLDFDLAESLDFEETAMAFVFTPGVYVLTKEGREKGWLDIFLKGLNIYIDTDEDSPVIFIKVDADYEVEY